LLLIFFFIIIYTLYNTKKIILFCSSIYEFLPCRLIIHRTLYTWTRGIKYTADILPGDFILQYKDIIALTFEDYQESLTLWTFNIWRQSFDSKRRSLISVYSLLLYMNFHYSTYRVDRLFCAGIMRHYTLLLLYWNSFVKPKQYCITQVIILCITKYGTIRRQYCTNIKLYNIIYGKTRNVLMRNVNVNRQSPYASNDMSVYWFPYMTENNSS